MSFSAIKNRILNFARHFNRFCRWYALRVNYFLLVVCMHPVVYLSRVLVHTM